MNSTITKFGYPGTTVAEYDHWVVMLREKQISAGCLILVCKEEQTSFPEISLQAFAELKAVTADVETNLKEVMQFERINYIILMMVDPHVHFHVIPRHSSARNIAGFVIEDAGWPKHPAFQNAAPLTAGDLSVLCSALRERWKRALL